MTGETLLFKTLELELPNTISSEMDYVIDIVYMQVAKILLRPLDHCEYNFSRDELGSVYLDDELEEYLYSQYSTFIDIRLHGHIVGVIENLAERLINSVEMEPLMVIVGSIDGVAYNYDRSLNHVRWYITVR